MILRDGEYLRERVHSALMTLNHRGSDKWISTGKNSRPNECCCSLLNFCCSGCGWEVRTCVGAMILDRRATTDGIVPVIFESSTGPLVFRRRKEKKEKKGRKRTEEGRIFDSGRVLCAMFKSGGAKKLAPNERKKAECQWAIRSKTVCARRERRRAAATGDRHS